jgi:hypothetical protein
VCRVFIPAGSLSLIRSPHPRTTHARIKRAIPQRRVRIGPDPDARAPGRLRRRRSRQRAVYDVDWVISSEPVVTIGVLDGAPEYVFSRIRGVRLLADGRLIVGDGGSGTLRVYDPDGRHLTTMGGPGDGPGEFAYLSSIHVAGDDTIRAYDSSTYRLTTFSIGGDLLSTETFQRADGAPEIYLGRYADGGHALGWIKASRIIPDQLVFDSMRIGRFGDDGMPREILATPTGMRRIGSPVPLSPHLLAGMVGDTVVYTDGLGGSVELVGSSGEVVRSLRLGGPGWTFDGGMQRVREQLDSAGLARLENVLETPGIEFVPEFSDLFIDDTGRIWLKLYEPGTDSHWLSRRLTGGEWRIYDTAGEQVGRATMPARFRPMDARGGRIAGIVRDELDVERVQVFVLEGMQGS